MGKHHADQIRATSGLEVRAAFDIDPARREAARNEQPGVTVYDSYDKLLDDPAVDMVVLITPHDTHAPLSIRASQAGKHVVTEKVMCLNTQEADEMICAADDAKKMLTVYQNRRWDGDFLTIRRLIDSGLLGSIFSIESSVNGHWFPGGWRGVKKHGGGMLYDWGAHLSDQLVQIMLPARPITVFATFHHTGHDVDVETQATVAIQFDNGVMAQVDVGCVSWLTRPRWLVRGERGAALMQDWDNCKVRGRFEGQIVGELTVPVEPSAWNQFYPSVSAHLSEGCSLPVDPAEVRIAIGILEAAFESGRTGASVKL